jgi:hypothetical protein
MRRLVLFNLAALCLMAWAAAAVLLQARAPAVALTLPTPMMLPTLTPSATRTTPPTPSLTPTTTPSPTASATDTPTPTPTVTLAVRLLEQVAIMPGVFVPPAATPVSPDLTVLPAPPDPVEPLPDATDTAPPYFGWYRFESDHPSIRYAPPWTPRLSQFASRGQYHRTEGATDTATFMFQGEGLRVRYVAAQNMGMFEIVVDGVVLDTIDAYADALWFPVTAVYVVGSGDHQLMLRGIGRKHSASEGYVIGLDAIEVFRGDAHILILPPASVTGTPTLQPQPAARIEQVDAPPPPPPTWTPAPVRMLSAAVVIAYDENGNRAVDPAEGVSGISVRVVESSTNRVLASAITDAAGYASFALVSEASARLVVPYFGQSWELSRSGSRAPSTFTLLLRPGNQPGLIP